MSGCVADGTDCLVLVLAKMTTYARVESVAWEGSAGGNTTTDPSLACATAYPGIQWGMVARTSWIAQGRKAMCLVNAHDVPRSIRLR